MVPVYLNTNGDGPLRHFTFHRIPFRHFPLPNPNHHPIPNPNHIPDPNPKP